MAREILIKVKDFNQPSIREELLAISGLPAISTQFAGFENVRGELNRIRPFPEATRVIARTERGGVITEDVAARGEVRFDSRNPLTAGEVSAIEAVLDSHDAAVDHSSQTKQRQQAADQAELRALFDAGIVDRTEELTVKLLLGELGEDV
jgi:hypothetical protein